MTKAAYVLAEARKTPASNTHHCHWPGCEAKCAPAFWSCPKHWRLLPRNLQVAIWKYFRKGQERDKVVTRLYVEASRAAQAWAVEYEARQPKTAPLFGASP